MVEHTRILLDDIERVIVRCQGWVHLGDSLAVSDAVEAGYVELEDYPMSHHIDSEDLEVHRKDDVQRELEEFNHDS